MSNMSLLTTTSDGQQVFLTPPILAAGSDPTTGIVFTENPANKTIVLQDTGDPGVPGTSSGLQYTLIEDPGSETGYAVEFSSSGQQGKKLRSGS